MVKGSQLLAAFKEHMEVYALLVMEVNTTSQNGLPNQLQQLIQQDSELFYKNCLIDYLPTETCNIKLTLFQGILSPTYLTTG